MTILIKFDADLRRGDALRVDILAQISSGAHRAQGRNWLGLELVGCLLFEHTFVSKLRNLGCRMGRMSVICFSDLDLMQLIQVGRLFCVGSYLT